MWTHRMQYIFDAHVSINIYLYVLFMTIGSLFYYHREASAVSSYLGYLLWQTELIATTCTLKQKRIEYPRYIWGWWEEYGVVGLDFAIFSIFSFILNLCVNCGFLSHFTIQVWDWQKLFDTSLQILFLLPYLECYTYLTMILW